MQTLDIEINLTQHSLDEVDKRLDVFVRMLERSRERQAEAQCWYCTHWVPVGSLVCWFCRQMRGMESSFND